MKVLTIIANPSSKSFCHAVLEQFSKGLADAGHVNEVMDLYAIDHPHRQDDVIAQWEKLNSAQGLAVISPVYGLYFPVLLKGWFQRIFPEAGACALTSGCGEGAAVPRAPVLEYRKALIINTTLFFEEDYLAAWQAPLAQIVDGWGWCCPAIQNIEHILFYRVGVSDTQTLRRYLERAYLLGREFAAA